MSHQPYENFLFSEETINSEQKQMLELHLGECEYCSSLVDAMTNLEELFSSCPAPDPAPGFTQRWQARLNEYRQKRHSRNLWLMTMGLFTLAGFIILLVLTYHLQNFNLVYEFSHGIARASRFIAEVRSSLSLFRSLVTTLPFIIPIILVSGSGTLLALSILTITWFLTIIKLYSPIQERDNLS